MSIKVKILKKRIDKFNGCRKIICKHETLIKNIDKKEKFFFTAEVLANKLIKIQNRL